MLIKYVKLYAELNKHAADALCIKRIVCFIKIPSTTLNKKKHTNIMRVYYIIG